MSNYCSHHSRKLTNARFSFLRRAMKRFGESAPIRFFCVAIWW